MGISSLPPQYQQLVDQDTEEHSSAVTSVPFQAPCSDPSATVHYTVYTYQPSRPRTGDRDDVAGVFGKDKRETLQLVYKYFPYLAEFPVDRILLKVPAGDTWAKITDEAWQCISATKAPERILVQVVKTPQELRQEHRVKVYFISVMAALILLTLLIPLLGWMLGWF